MKEKRTEREILDDAYSDEAKATWRAPVQGNGGETIPWSVHLEAYKAYCAKWSPQVALVDLKGKGCRGGFHVGELDQLLPGWRDRASYVAALEAKVKELEAQVPKRVVLLSEKPLNPWEPTTDRHQLRVLGKLGEELAEGGQIVARCIIQGVDECEPVTGKLNRHQLEDELADVAATTRVAMEYFGLDPVRMEARSRAKVAHLNAWADLMNARNPKED